MNYYRVKQLADMSNITVRTLHWYDKIGLLKPAYYGKNNYRYYKKEQLIILQQILFFRDLGYKLDDIKALLPSSKEDKAVSLTKHKNHLKNNVKSIKKLINKIDNTNKKL